MTPAIAQQVADWLNGLPNKCFRNAAPVRVAFLVGDRSFEFYGAKSEQLYVAQEGERYVTDGIKLVGEEWWEPRFELVGKMPNRFRKTDRFGFSKVSFRIDGDDGDWFASGYYEGWPNNFHPFGSYFTVRRWNHELPWMGRIDVYADKPNERIAMTVEHLSC